MVRTFLMSAGAAIATIVVVGLLWTPAFWAFVLVLPLVGVGIRDAVQTKHAVKRNFPLIGTARYLFEFIRPEINQYFIESETDGRPFSREQRSIVYQRAKLQLQTLPFGTQHDVYEPGYEWIDHSIEARVPMHEAPRVVFGAGRCAKPYESALLNVSAMSFGSLSGAAIRALNAGARIGGFAHNTGEGSISDHHRSGGGDLIWQIGTGYFGCRDADGNFDPAMFADRASDDQVRMIEVKLSQGAKPGHGGILPARKITDEIAAIRGVAKDRDVVSPPTHTAFRGPKGLLEFVESLRERSGGKPVGFKLCVGHPHEVVAIGRAMVETGMRPDFITVDGGEGGTGAAPLEFSNSLGSPLTEGLILVRNMLVGLELKRDVRLVASGRIITGFDMALRIALGADAGNSARGFMLSLGCIQARRCNANVCPVGVATTDPGLERGLVVEDKKTRVANFQRETVHALLELVAAAGLDGPHDLEPWHVHRRVSETQVLRYDQIHRFLDAGELLAHPPAEGGWDRLMRESSPDSFSRAR